MTPAQLADTVPVPRVVAEYLSKQQALCVCCGAAIEFIVIGMDKHKPDCPLKDLEVE